MDIKQIIKKVNIWFKFKSLYYRTEIVWFSVGFIIGLTL